MAKNKFYAVLTGRKTGIFNTWDEAKNSVEGYKNAKYKSFSNLKDAESWINNGGSTVQAEPDSSDNCEKIVIYSDGGSINNPGPGGYGSVIIRNGKEEELTQGYRLTTNNRMELMGVIAALEYIGKTDISVEIFCDSQYVINGISKGWAKSWKRKGWKKSDGQPALNPDLWQRLLELTDRINYNFIWVKGHSGNRYNERCDELAVNSARSGNYKVDSYYEEK